MPIEFKRESDNIFKSKAHTIVNPVNCQGVMGAGLALQFYKQLGFSYIARYQWECNYGDLHRGIPVLDRETVPWWVLNFPTKYDWRKPSNLRMIEEGLGVTLVLIKEWRIPSIAFPKLGCGLGGLDWAREVRPLMLQLLEGTRARVELYE